MDFQEKIIFWLNKYKSMFNIKVLNNTWPNRLGLHGYFDYSVQMTYRGQTFFGRGFDSDENKAFLVAVIECFERVVVKFNNIKNSNGVAAHLFQEAAISNATNELIERDSFFCHYLTKIPFYFDLNFKNFEDVDFIDLYKFLIKYKLEVKQFKMYSAVENSFSIVTVIFGHEAKKPFGMAIGSAVNTDFSTAVYKSLKEATLLAVKQFLDPLPALTTHQFLNLKKFEVLNHAQVGFCLDYAKEFRRIFCFTKNSYCKVNHYINNQMIVKKLLIPNELSSLKLYFYQVSNKNLQSLFFGETISDKINIKRLKSFSPEFSLHKLNYTPHPYA